MKKNNFLLEVIVGIVVSAFIGLVLSFLILGTKYFSEHLYDDHSQDTKYSRIETFDWDGDMHEYVVNQLNDTTRLWQHYSHCKYCSPDSIKSKLGVIQSKNK